MRAAWMALAGEDPELISTLRAYPRQPHSVSPNGGVAATDSVVGEPIEGRR
jgi:hypothetical protein